MSDRMKALGLFALIASLWYLGTQIGVAQATDTDTLEVPEPTSMSLLVGGVAAALYAAWRSRK
jgi:hypothetical protein